MLNKLWAFQQQEKVPSKEIGVGFCISEYSWWVISSQEPNIIEALKKAARSQEGSRKK